MWNKKKPWYIWFYCIDCNPFLQAVHHNRRAMLMLRVLLNTPLLCHAVAPLKAPTLFIYLTIYTKNSAWMGSEKMDYATGVFWEVSELWLLNCSEWRSQLQTLYNHLCSPHEKNVWCPRYLVWYIPLNQWVNCWLSSVHVTVFARWHTQRRAAVRFKYRHW